MSCHVSPNCANNCDWVCQAGDNKLDIVESLNFEIQPSSECSSFVQIHVSLRICETSYCKQCRTIFSTSSFHQLRKIHGLLV